MMLRRIGTAQRAAHGLDCKQAVHPRFEQCRQRDIGIILAIAMRMAEQAIKIGVTLLILRHQHQCILQDQR